MVDAPTIEPVQKRRGRKPKYISKQRMNISLAHDIVRTWGEKGESFESVVSKMHDALKKIIKVNGGEQLSIDEMNKQLDDELNGEDKDETVT